MSDALNPLATEQTFFAALIAGNVSALGELLADEFTLVDVMRGMEISKPALLAALAAGQVKFEAITPSETRVRNFGPTIIVNGRTEMRGQAGEEVFTMHSRYTHVYVEQQGRLRLASAQGTPIADA